MQIYHLNLFFPVPHHRVVWSDQLKQKHLVPSPYNAHNEHFSSADEGLKKFWHKKKELKKMGRSHQSGEVYWRIYHSIFLIPWPFAAYTHWPKCAFSHFLQHTKLIEDGLETKLLWTVFYVSVDTAFIVQGCDFFGYSIFFQKH